MSHFYGRMNGGRKHDVTRCGHKGQGIRATLSSWEHRTTTRLYHENNPEGVSEDRVKITVDGITLYDGTFAQIVEDALAVAKAEAHTRLKEQLDASLIQEWDEWATSQ